MKLVAPMRFESVEEIVGSGVVAKVFGVVADVEERFGDGRSAGVQAEALGKGGCIAMVEVVVVK